MSDSAERAATAGEHAGSGAGQPAAGGERPRETPAAGRRVPDFFIAGHPKCGTTALYIMLRSHPQIFMPDVKEPRYFAFDLRSRFATDSPPKPLHTLDGYLALFDAAAPEQLAGEASPQYLRSHDAPAAIAELRPDARIIAIIREPASFLRSFHMQMVSSNVETERDFRRAMELEGARREGKRIPRQSHHPEALLYANHVRYAEQLSRFAASFPAEQLLTLVYDDFRADNDAVLGRVLRFLGVDDSPRLDVRDTKPVNAIRSPALHRLANAARGARTNPDAAGPLAKALDRATAPLRGDAFKTAWRRVAYREPDPPDERFMTDLRRRFKPEVEKVSEHLGRDLVSEWGYDTLG